MWTINSLNDLIDYVENLNGILIDWTNSKLSN
jgi:hypothetical protein